MTSISPLFSTENCNKTALAPESSRLATIPKVKTKNRKHSANEAATKDKTFAPRRHGDTEGKDKWGPSGPLVHLRFRPGQSVDISTLSPQQKDEDTEKAGGLEFRTKSSQAAPGFFEYGWSARVG